MTPNHGVSSRELRERLDASIVRITASTIGVVAMLAMALFLVIPRPADVAPEARAARMVVSASLIVLTLLVVFLVRRGSVRWAARLLVSSSFVTLLVMPIVVQLGVHSAGLPLLAAVIMLTGFLIHPAGALVSMGLAIAAIIGLFLAEAGGLLSGPMAGTRPGSALLAGANIILFCIVGWLAMRYASLFGNTIKTLEQAREELEEALTAKRESEENLKHAQAVAHVGSWTMDIPANAITWSDETYRIFGLAPGQPLKLETFLEAAHEDDRERVMAAWHEALAGTTYDIEHRIRARDQVRWVHSRAEIVRGPDGAPQLGIGTVQDVTERKQAAALMLQAQQKAEAANVAKSRFLATMSHEIRTPMNGILGMAQLLMLPNIKEEEREEYARVILHSGETLLTLLNDILDLSKIEAGKVELQQMAFRPEELITETATLFHEVAQAKGLSLETTWRGEGGHEYLGDPIRLRQMLSNLVGNALKFTQRGFIRIEGRVVEAGDETSLLEFSVTDSGIGIPADKQSLLFQPFSQVDGSTTRAYGGTGLGLSIVRDLAVLMGGDIDVESEAGQGSRFRFHIRAGRDLEAGQPPGPGLEDSAGAPLGPLAGHVLIVEDDAANRFVLETMLRKQGLRYESVENGQDAVAAIAAGSRPALVLMDCQMPVMDGYETTRQIRDWDRTSGAPRLPIVALTASAYREDRKRCLAAGMDDFMTKPIALRELKAVLAKAMGGAAEGSMPAAPPRS